jgi:hypothetical protein
VTRHMLHYRFFATIIAILYGQVTEERTSETSKAKASPRKKQDGVANWPRV